MDTSQKVANALRDDKVQRLSALALLIALIILIASSVWTFVSAAWERREEILRYREELGRLQHTIEVMETSTRTNSDIPAAILEKVFFANEISQVNRARLQEHLKSLAAQSGVQLSQIADLPDSTADKVVWIGMRISATGRYENMARFIAALERSTPALFVTSARLTVDPDPIRAATTEARLDSLLEVRAAVLPSKSSEPDNENQ